MPTWIKRIFNMIIEYTSDISNLITNKADLVDGKVPAEQLPSYVDDVIEFNNLQAPDTQISIIVGNNSYKNQIRFINGSSTSSNRIGSEDKYPNMFVNFGENTSEDDWTTFEPEKGKIYINTTNNHSYRWSGSQLIDLDQSWSNDIKDLQENTVSIKSQTLTEAQQAQVWQNLGLDLVVLKFPKGVTSITLTDEEDAKLQLGAAVLVTADSTDTTSNIYNANNHIFTTVDSKNTSQPLYYSLALFSGLLYCSYNKVSKKFTYQGIIRLIDTGAVRFDRTTPLTSAQQEQALDNIGFPLVHLDFALIGTTLDDNIYNAVASAKGIILENVPDGNNAPSLYLVGNSDTVTTIFVSEFNARVWFVLTLSHTSKKLSLTSTGYITDVVRYSEGQDLTNTQKDTVLSNIGLKWVNVPYSLLNTTLGDATYTKIKNAYGIILTDVPSDYFGPREFICGSNNSDGTKVFAGLNLANTSAYIVLYVNHNLTNVRYARSYDGAVPYDTSKTLTSDQQDVALSNIGLNFVHVDYSLLGTTLTDEMFAVLDNARGIIVVNTSSNYDNPTVFIKGINSSTACFFVSHNTGTTYCQIKLDKSTKILSNINANLTYTGTVRYIEKQSLTDTQKQQARSNIGATSCYDEYKLAGGTKYTTEADFNAQLVKVMNMTVVE